MELLTLITVIMGLYLAWSVGASTFGATIGINLGSTNFPKKTAIIFSSIAAVLGIAFLSNRIVDTISKDLIKLDIIGLISILITIIVITTIIVFRGIPISTTYAIVGALTGYAVASGTGINFATLEKIVVSMFCSPFGALVVAFIIYNIMKLCFIGKNAGIRKIESFEMKFFMPGFISLIVLTFGLGANSVGIVLGLLGERFSFPFLVLIGSAGLVLGIATLGGKTAHKIGIELIDLSPSRGFVAILATGLTIIAFVYTGIPVSTSQTLIGAIVGVGLARKNVNVRQATKVSLTWLIVLPAAVTIISLLASALIGLAI